MTVEAENVVPNSCPNIDTETKHNLQDTSDSRNSAQDTSDSRLSSQTSSDSKLSSQISSDSSQSGVPTESPTTPDVQDVPQFVVRDYKVQECMSNRNDWYSKSKNYWKEVPSTIDGMLGGYGSLTHSDLCSSAQFIAKLYTGLNTELALDCGAGIGRVTKGLLLNIFDRVEMIDTCQEHLDSAQQFLGEEMFARVPAQHCCGLEDFHPAPNTYDLVWMQWVIIYLSDYDFIQLLARFKKSLKKDGYIIVKDNVTRNGCELDDTDSSVTRSDYQLKQIFKRAGLELHVDSYQKNFPRELYKVKYYALR